MQYLRERLMLLMIAATLFAAVAIPPRGAEAANAAAGSLSQQIPCTIAGLPGTCTLTVTSFQVINGVLTAVGTIAGGGISIPFQVPVSGAQGTCEILTLTLGPLHLDLLGLVVDLNQVVLTITAQSGSGQLLGNLLCEVAHLLDNNSFGSILDQLANLLNQILAAL
jgi:hypothetical protein